MTDRELTDEAAALLCWSCLGSGRDTDICGCCEMDCEECKGSGLRVSEPPVYVPPPPRTPEQVAADEAAYQERLAAMSPTERAMLEALQFMRRQLYAPARGDVQVFDGPFAFYSGQPQMVGEARFANLLGAVGPVTEADLPKMPASAVWYRQHDAEARRALRDAGIIPWLPPFTDDERIENQIEKWIDEGNR